VRAGERSVRLSAIVGLGGGAAQRLAGEVGEALDIWQAAVGPGQRRCDEVTRPASVVEAQGPIDRE
jgi:hypothetical protein